MKKIVYNMELCDSCFKCHSACAKLHSDKGGLSCRKMKKLDNPVNKSFKLVTESCRHCEDPTCLNNCSHNALSVDLETGFVVTNEENCIGCKICSFVCPFDIPKFFNEKLVKCDGCNERVKSGLLPACVEICEAHALRLIDCK